MQWRARRPRRRQRPGRRRSVRGVRARESGEPPLATPHAPSERDRASLPTQHRHRHRAGRPDPSNQARRSVSGRGSATGRADAARSPISAEPQCRQTRRPGSLIECPIETAGNCSATRFTEDLRQIQRGYFSANTEILSQSGGGALSSSVRHRSRYMPASLSSGLAFNACSNDCRARSKLASR